MIEINKLKALAEAATPGPWEVQAPWRDSATDSVTLKPGYWFSPGHYPKCYLDEDPKLGIKDASFIAAANPAVVLELIGRLKGMEEALRASCPTPIMCETSPCCFCIALAAHGTAKGLS